MSQNDTVADVVSKLDVEQVRWLARLNGLELSPERAAQLVEPLRAVLRADALLAEMSIGHLPVVGLPWAGSELADGDT